MSVQTNPSATSSSGATTTMASNVGPLLLTDGPNAGTIRQDRFGAQVVTESHARYQEATSRGAVYSAGNQSAVAITAGLATTYTGLVLINPPGSGINLSILDAGIATSAAASALGSWALIGGWVATGLTAFTAIATTLWGNNLINTSVNNSKAAVAAAGVTLTGTPRFLKHYGSVFTTQSEQTNGLIDVQGSIVVGPGGYVAHGMSTNGSTAFAWLSFTWEEISITAGV